MKTQAPKSITLVIAIILFLIGVAVLYGNVRGISHGLAQLCLVISNILLILGALVKGI
ncbi:MAG: hypothetical protein HXS46_01805 [Theionarchaea archaeon]|nr:hypothetical protein [Theionarchaea archaeon]